MLLSRKSKTRNAHEENEREQQNKEIQEKFVVRNGTVYDFSVWRTEELSKLVCSTYTLPETAEEISGDVLFKHNISLHVLHEFRGHDVEHDPEMISSIMILARLDSWIMTFAECMSMEDGRGGQRQKLFNELYYKFLPMATRQLVEKVCYIVWRNNSNELLIRCSPDERGDDPFEYYSRTVTIILESMSENRFYIAVRPDWFEGNVSKYLGKVCDCYVGEGTRNGQLFQLHGMESAEGTEDIRDREEATEPPNSSNVHFTRYRS